MATTIQKWGNSHAVRLPKSILDISMIRESDIVTFQAREGEIIIKKAEQKHRTLKERLAKARSECAFKEWDSGEPQGREVM